MTTTLSHSRTRPSARKDCRRAGFRPHRLTGASSYVLLADPGARPAILLTTSLGVAVVGVGLVMLLVLVPLNEQLANVHRRLSGRILGVEIEKPYLEGQDRLALAAAEVVGE